MTEGDFCLTLLNLEPTDRPTDQPTEIFKDPNLDRVSLLRHTSQCRAQRLRTKVAGKLPSINMPHVDVDWEWLEL